MFRTLDSLDWKAIEHSLDSVGYAHLPGLVQERACQKLIQVYADDHAFRSRIVMERYNFGEGEYSYFAEPLPTLVSELRTQLYEHLAPLANRMMMALQAPHQYPGTLEQFRHECAKAGQTKPTPLMLRYEQGGFNCLHRDLYGETLFPLQTMVMLSQHREDFEGGEFVLVENRHRQQSRATVLIPNLGDLIIFPVSDRPVQGKRNMLRATVRHGVSRVKAGTRWTLGIIFHDAK